MSTLTERVDILLEQRGLNRTQLADAIGLSKDKMSKSMAGSRQFTVSEIATIGECLDVDLYWLIHGRVDPLGTKVAFRHVYDEAESQHEPPGSDERADLELVQRAYSLAEAPAEQRFTSFRAKVGAVADPSWSQIRECAAKVRQEWISWIQDRPQELDVEGFLASVGVDLIVLPSPMGKRAQTYSLELRGRSVVVVHTTRAWYSAVFGVFHELAHLLFGHLEWRTDSPREWQIPAEKVANGFAADLLLPATDIWALKGEETLETLAELCWTHQIGAGTLSNRCKHLGKSLKPPTQKQLTDVWLKHCPAASDARATEWQTPRFPHWLIARHEELVAKGAIPAQTLAEMTDTPVEDLAPAQVPQFTNDVADALAELGL